MICALIVRTLKRGVVERFPSLAAVAAVMGLLGALSLGACGGDSDEDKVRQVIDTVATSRDPANCTELMTQRFVEQTELEKGEAALRSCRESAKTDEPADSVDVSEVEVNGDEAGAVAAFKGGDSDGQTYTVTLAKTDGDWKLSRITAIDIDREKLDGALKRTLTRPPDALTREQADCVVRTLRKVSDAEIEQALVRGDVSVFLGAFRGCIRE